MNNRGGRLTLIRLLFFIAFFSLPSTAMALFTFKSDALSATVVDSGTGSPVSGAIVIVEWTLERGLLHGHDRKNLKRFESVTDSNGSFSFRAWGPKFAMPAWKMAGSSPLLVILKSGYSPKIASNYMQAMGGYHCEGSKRAEISRYTHENSLIVSSWDGCPIGISKVTDDLDEYAKSLSFYHREFCDQSKGVYCGEKVVEFFEKERERLRSIGVKRPYWW